MVPHLSSIRTPLFTVALFAVAGVLHAQTAPSPQTPEMATGQAVRDFQPLSGYVVEAHGDGYVIDLDASRGVSAGDLFTVIGPGRELSHPVTGESLGTLDAIKGTLKVARVESGYSLTRVLGPDNGIVRGDPIKRYQNVQAAFIDRTGNGEPVYLELKRGLPHLDWLAYASGPEGGEPAPQSATGLLFEFDADALSVRDADKQLLKRYPFAVAGSSPAPSDIALGSATVGALAAPTAPAPGPLASAPAPGPLTSAPAPYPLEQPVMPYQPEFSRARMLAALPRQVTIADFVVFDNNLWVAATDGNEIWVFEGKGEGAIVSAKGKTSTMGEILSVHWWQPSRTKERPYLVATVWNGEPDGAQGAIFAWSGKRLVPVLERIGYILASFDRDGDGQRELLLGQSFVRDGFFGKRVRALELRGGSLQASSPDFNPPRHFTVQGATFADITGDGKPELAFVRYNMLYIHAASGKLLYQSPPQVGGSLSGITYEVDPEFDFSPVATVPFELSPVAVDLNGDRAPELITVAVDKPLMRAPGIGLGIKKSWLAVFEYRNDSVLKGRLGPDRDVPVQGLAVVSNAVLFIVPESQSFFSGAKGKSQLRGFPVRR